MSATRTTIMTNLQTQLENITTANGYATNIGNSVEIWRLAPLSEADLPLMNLKDTACEHIHQAAMGGIEHHLTVDIEVYMAAIGDLRDAMNDILTCLSEDRRLSGTVETITFMDSRVEGDQKETRLYMAHLPLLITYRTSDWGI